MKQTILASPETFPQAFLATAKRTRDRRPATLFSLLALVLALGYGFSRLPGRGVDALEPGSAPPAVRSEEGFSGLAASSGGLREEAASRPLELPDEAHDAGGVAGKIIRQAESSIKAKQYDQAIGILNQSVPLMLKHPGSYVLLGRALEGKKEYAAARDFYKAALDRNPYMADAYWGYATASEGMGDLESALGGMRNYLHTEPDLDPNRLRVAQARSAIWEWESQLGRGPWGPTKGIPPGLKAADIKRDGRGVAVKMQESAAEQGVGSAPLELKHANKIKIFPRP